VANILIEDITNSQALKKAFNDLYSEYSKEKDMRELKSRLAFIEVIISNYIKAIKNTANDIKDPSLYRMETHEQIIRFFCDMEMANYLKYEKGGETLYGKIDLSELHDFIKEKSECLNL